MFTRRHRHFNPKRAGFQYVYDARYVNGVAQGGAVSSWPNNGTPAEPAVQATGNRQPTFSRTTLAGRPTVDFVRTRRDRLAASALLTGLVHKSVIAAYISTSTSDPLTPGTYVDSIAGQANTTTIGAWFALQSRNRGVNGDPYLAGHGRDTLNNASTPDDQWKIGGRPTAQLVFSLTPGGTGCNLIGAHPIR